MAGKTESTVRQRVGEGELGLEYARHVFLNVARPWLLCACRQFGSILISKVLGQFSLAD